MAIPAPAQRQHRRRRPRAGRRPLRVDPWAAAALAAACLYGALRLYWQVGSAPPGRMSIEGPELVLFTGWGGVALCAAAAGLAAAFAAVPTGGAARHLLLWGAYAAGAALVVAGAVLVLDVVGLLLPGLGIPRFPLGALSRAVCAGTGVLLALAARSYRRRTATGCRDCGRSGTAAERERTPRWAFAAAYAAIGGWLARVLAQAWVGFDAVPFGDGPARLVFEAGFVLAGTLLPLALVHSWGRRWPAPLPGLGGRGVPRWLVLAPAAAVAAALLSYFGVMLLTMITDRLAGRAPFPPSGGLALPEAFFWVAVPGYVLWGAGVAAAALAYHRRTRPTCRSCGR